jgi:hypothetical protein
VGSNNLYSLKSSIKTEKSHFFSYSYIIKESSPTCKFSRGTDRIQDSYSVFKKIPDELLRKQFVFVCPGLSPLARVARFARNEDLEAAHQYELGRAFDSDIKPIHTQDF